MKETYYFSHDYNARYDHKIKRLIANHGYLGYGLFWAIVEDLYNNANALQTDYESIAFDLRTTPPIIESIINDFSLFVIEDGFFGSLSIEERLNARIQKSKKATESAKIRWNKSDSNANAIQTQCDSNAIKESKGKESKGKESKINKEDIEVTFDFKKSLIDFGFDTELVKDWLAVRFKKKSANTKTAFNIFVGQVIKSGADKNKILELCVCKGWISFNHKWLIDTPDLIQQVEPIQQAITQKEKPMTTLRRYDFRTVYEYFKEVKKRGEKHNPFDYSIPENLREGLSDEDEMILQVDIQKRFPNGLPDEEI